MPLKIRRYILYSNYTTELPEVIMRFIFLNFNIPLQILYLYVKIMIPNNLVVRAATFLELKENVTNRKYAIKSN